jgi:hypothetical protein
VRNRRNFHYVLPKTVRLSKSSKRFEYPGISRQRERRSQHRERERGERKKREKMRGDEMK